MLEISLLDSAMRPDLISNCLKARNHFDKVQPSVSQSIVISWDQTWFDRLQHLSISQERNVKTMLSMSVISYKEDQQQNQWINLLVRHFNPSSQVEWKKDAGGKLWEQQ